MKRYIHAGFVAGILIASGVAQAADQFTEAEANHPIGAAQKVEPNGMATIAAALGNATGTATVDDVDYYSFYGTAGDVVTFDIDGGYGGGGTRNVDTVMAVFSTATGNPILAMNDDAKPLDPGSTDTRDSRIENVRLETSGYYIVAVSNYPRSFLDGGSVRNPTRVSNGDYKLIITGVSPPVQQINIEIKPGSREFTPVNPKSKGKIPVALLSSTQFDALTVDTTSLTFGATGAEESHPRCSKEGEDVNGDGRQDLVCHFENQEAKFEEGSMEGILRGKMKWGSRIEGRGFLKVVPYDNKPE